MKRSLAVALTVWVLGLAGFALDRNAFTFTAYDLEVRVDPAQQSLAANGKLTLRNDSTAPQRNAVLQISSSLDWTSVTVGNKPVQYVSQPYVSDTDHTGALSEAIVTLPQAVAPGGSVELEIAYAGTVAPDATRLTRIGAPAEVAARSDWDRIAADFTALRGAGCVAWYPIATEAASLSEGDAVFSTLAAWKQREAGATARFRLSVMSPRSGSMIVANGSAAVGNGTSSLELRYEPLGFTVPSFAIAGFQRKTAATLDFYYLPGHEQHAEGWAERGQSVQPLITRWFGPARSRMRIVELPDLRALPFESGNLVFTPLAGEDSGQIELTLAHQLTHAVISSPRLWISEGLAHFAQALMAQQQGQGSGSNALAMGRKAALAYMDRQLPELAAAEQAQLPPAPSAGTAPPASRGQPLVNTADEVFYRTKAMFVWWMLRDMAGDEALQRAIQSYRADDDKEPSYVQRLLSEHAHRDLEWFFDDWVYRDRGLPEFSIISAHPRRLLPSDYSVTVEVENSGGAAAEVLVTVHADHGDVERRIEVHAHEKAAARMPVPDTPLEALVNDGGVPEYTLKNNRVPIKLPSR